MATASPWESFTQDPRRPETASLRASDRDRDVVLGVLTDGYAEGRLTKQEYDERAETTAAAKTLGELVPIIVDLVPPERARTDLARATPSELERLAVERFHKERREAVNGLLFISAICWGIWLLTGMGFPWPVFPTVFVALRVPQVLLNRKEIVARELAKLERKQRKALGSGDSD